MKAEGIEEVKKTLQITPEVQYILDFVASSKRGIIPHGSLDTSGRTQ